MRSARSGRAVARAAAPDLFFDLGCTTMISEIASARLSRNEQLVKARVATLLRGSVARVFAAWKHACAALAKLLPGHFGN